MLDKETVTARPNIQDSEEPDDLFLECVDRAREYVEDEEVEECFERVMSLDWQF